MKGRLPLSSTEHSVKHTLVYAFLVSFVSLSAFLNFLRSVILSKGGLMPRLHEIDEIA